MGDKFPHNTCEKKQLIPQQSHLSDDLIIQEILTRLPVKSILRFKFVSKQWYSSLSSSHFANACLMRSPFPHPSTPVNTLFIHKTRRNVYYLFTYDDDQISVNFEDNLVKLDVDFGDEEDSLELTGCCNGLICLTPFSYEYFIIWNPATHKFHKYASDGYLKRFGETDRFSVISGFGYASCVDDYKYIRILRYANTNMAHLFSLRENRWRNIDFGHHPLHIYGDPVFVNEKFYWVSENDEAGGKLVVTFDIGVERYDVIMPDLDKSDMLGVMRGCLSKCKCSYIDTFVGENLLHIIMEPPLIVKSIGLLPNGLRLDMVSEMIGFTKTDKFFVTGPVSDDGRDFLSRMLGIVDTSTEPMQYTTLLRFKEWIKIAKYVPSLVSPFPKEEA